MTVIATAGHVDHGKSSLVRAICGTDPDRLAEEKRRGMTIELGFAHHVTDHGVTLSFVDVPGHIDFVRTMVAGASAADVALLVIDAGEGWMPQTEEHVAILGLLGITRGVVAVTKADRVDGHQLDSVLADVAARLGAGNVVWDAIVPVSVVDGRGVDSLVNLLAGAVHDSTAAVPPPGRTRMFIDRVFTLRGQGTVVTGTLDSGTVTAGDVLVVSRTGREVRLRSVQTHGLDVETGLRRTRCALNLSSTDTASLRRGDALVSSGDWFVTGVFDASVTVLAGARALRRRNGYALHIGTAETTASVAVIGGESVEPGHEGTVRVRFAAQLPLAPGDRFLLRDPGTSATVGGGIVLDVDPRARISRAAPSHVPAENLRGRGWLTVDEARRLTGLPLEPVAGRWYAADDLLESTSTELRERAADGTLDVAVLTEAERSLLSALGIDPDAVRDVPADALEQHPVAESIRSAGVTPPPSTGLDRDLVRRMVHAGILFEHDGIAFHRDVLLGLRDHLRGLWADSPGGLTVSQLRGSLGITRKHAVPLGECLDRAGVTTRRGDVRLPGPRA